MATAFERDEAHEWLLKFHAASDGLDAKHWTDNFYAEDASLTFCNYPTIHGRDNIREMFEASFNGLDKMEHKIVRFDVLPDRIYQPAEITYVVKDDPEKKEIVISGIAIFVRDERNKQHVKEFIVYLDPTPLEKRRLVVEEMKTAGRSVVKG